MGERWFRQEYGCEFTEYGGWGVRSGSGGEGDLRGVGADLGLTEGVFRATERKYCSLQVCGSWRRAPR